MTMDFVEGLPLSENKDSILVMVDRFSKYAHFIALKHPYNAKQIATIFFEQVHKLHGLPETIISDRDYIFIGQLWTQLFKLLGTQLCHSTSYHPQSDVF